MVVESRKCASNSDVRSVFICFALILLTACAVQPVDLGSNQLPSIVPTQSVDDAGAAPPFVPFVGCGIWNNADVAAKRGPVCKTQHTCSAQAGDVAATMATVSDVVALTAGRWLFCKNDILSDVGTGGPPQRVIGLEFGPGCVTYALVTDRDGAPVRGTEAGDQGTFDIVREYGKPLSIVLRTKFRGTFPLRIESARCPNNYLRLLDEKGRGLTLQSAGTDPAQR
jgi:hypothetical protein